MASQTTYNAASEPLTTTDELGNVRTFSYDANFWPKLASDSVGPVVSFTFNANGTMASKAVGYNLATSAGTATAYVYDQYGNLTSQTDALGRQTLYTYDTMGRLSTTTPPGGATKKVPESLSGQHGKTEKRYPREAKADRLTHYQNIDSTLTKSSFWNAGSFVGTSVSYRWQAIIYIKKSFVDDFEVDVNNNVSMG
jgi:YD repeat-containing protein